MQYHEIGKTGMKVSSLSFGASSLGGVFHDIKEKEGITAVFTAIESGINFIDVSPYYGHYKAETVLGKALKDIPRDRYYLSTKVGRYGKDGVNTWDYSAKRATESVYESMERLNIDFIDLINVHDIEFADLNHINHNTCSMQKCICIGEALRNQEFQLNTLGQKIHDKWPALQLYSTYASTEMQSSFTECNEFHGGHLQPELIIVEFLDDNNRPVEEGEAGEVTITTLGVKGMPLLRFKTGDICYHHTDPCGCGRNTIRLSSILGRKGQMIKYKGTTLYPPALFDILDNIPSVKNYIIEVYTNELGTDEILIRIGSENRSEAFAKEIKDLFRSKVRVAPSINFESAEYIAKIQMPPMSRKTIKFIDLR